MITSTILFPFLLGAITALIGVNIVHARQQKELQRLHQQQLDRAYYQGLERGRTTIPHRLSSH
jgi:hypothetical protein